jgi:hypothetical protein
MVTVLNFKNNNDDNFHNAVLATNATGNPIAYFCENSSGTHKLIITEKGGV